MPQFLIAISDVQACTKVYRQQRVRVVKRRAHDQHGLGSKPTRAILLCPWQRRFTAYSPAWWTWEAVQN